MSHRTCASAEPARRSASEILQAEYPHLTATSQGERLRGFCMGIVRRGLGGLVLVVAVQHFGATQSEKAWLMAASSLGMALTPLSLAGVSWSRLSVTRANALLFGTAALGIAATALCSNFEVYFWGLMAGLPLMAMSYPLVTALWRQNVPDLQRGHLFSTVSKLGVVGALIGTALMALWIGKDSSRYRPIFALLALTLLGAAWFSWRIPSRPLAKQSRNPLAGLAYLWRDRVFGYLCLTWMVMGFANLAVVPLRVQYIAAGQEEGGLSYSPWLVLVVVELVPQVASLLSANFWGRRFDRSNFMVLRIVLNVFFALNMLLFFLPSLWVQVLGSICFGLGDGGGEIAWNLWVTKFAPPERTAEYMTVHTFLTGVRGLLAPMLAFQLLDQVGLHAITWTCAGMIAVACLMLAPLIPLGARERRA